MSKKSSIFIRTKEETVTIGAKVPQSLKERIEQVKQELVKIDQGLSFDITHIIQTALTEAVDQAEREIKRLKSEPVSVRSTAQIAASSDASATV